MVMVKLSLISTLRLEYLLRPFRFAALSKRIKKDINPFYLRNALKISRESSAQESEVHFASFRQSRCLRQNRVERQRVDIASFALYDFLARRGESSVHVKRLKNVDRLLVAFFLKLEDHRFELTWPVIRLDERLRLVDETGDGLKNDGCGVGERNFFVSGAIDCLNQVKYGENMVNLLYTIRVNPCG